MTDSLISEFYGWLDQEEEDKVDEQEWQPEEKAAAEEVRIVSPPNCSPTAAAYRSICTSETAAMYAAKYKVPPEFGLCAPRAEERVHAPPPGYAAVYTHQFQYGLTLPLQPFVASLLAHFGITLAQLHPKGIIFILGFQEICRRTSVSPTPALFRRFFCFQKNRHTNGWYTFRSIGPGIVSHSSLRHWKASFLYFKTTPITENLDLSWNYSPVMDPQVVDNDRPSEQTIKRLLACIESSSKHKRGAVQQLPLEQDQETVCTFNSAEEWTELEEEEEEEEEDCSFCPGKMMQAKKCSMENETCRQRSPAARASIATLKPNTELPRVACWKERLKELPSVACWKERLTRKAEFDATEHAKILSFKDKTLDQKCFCSLCSLIKERIKKEEEEARNRSQQHDQNLKETKRAKGVNSKRKASTKATVKNKKAKQTPQDLPGEFKARIKERARGREVKKQVMVIQKTLTKTDVQDQQNRLSIPFNQVANRFLSEEEERLLLGRDADGHYNVMSVGVIEPTGEVDTVNLARWVMKKDGGKLQSITYVLNGEGWRSIKTCNHLEEGDTVQLWAVQIEDELCIVLVKLGLQLGGNKVELEKAKAEASRLQSAKEENVKGSGLYMNEITWKLKRRMKRLTRLNQRAMKSFALKPSPDLNSNLLNSLNQCVV